MSDHAPPPYEEAVTSAPVPRNGISPSARRSMEDEARPLPPGWVRCFDANYAHQYFVDTTSHPPRSIWHHPYDDKLYVDSLPPTERDNLAHEGLLSREPSHHDIQCESTDEEAGSVNRRPTNDGIGKLGKLERKVKDRLTRTTHTERQARREQRRQDEERAYEAYKHFRRTLEEAMRTHRPALLGIDDQGREVYLQPPGMQYPGAVREEPASQYLTEITYAPGAGPPGVGDGKTARFVRADGIYAHPGGVGHAPGVMGYGGGGGFGRPPSPYVRPYGGGFGGCVGLPFALPLMGGLMMGSLLF